MARRKMDFESERKAMAVKMGMFNIILYILTFIIGVLLIPVGIVLVMLYAAGLFVGKRKNTVQKN